MVVEFTLGKLMAPPRVQARCNISRSASRSGESSLSVSGWLGTVPISRHVHLRIVVVGMLVASMLIVFVLVPISMFWLVGAAL